jgi:Carboxypeptidase regulatory-like domain
VSAVFSASRLLLLWGIVLFGFSSLSWAQQPALSGTVTDPSGAVIVGAEVRLQGHGINQIQKTRPDGRYLFQKLPKGQFQLSVSSAGFEPTSADVRETGPQVVNIQLAIATKKEIVKVQNRTNGVGLDEADNASTIVIDRQRLKALSDDPDLLSEQLSALVPPGSQITVDGFRNIPVPPKNQIQEIKIVSNSYPVEFFTPGGTSIEITTKGGNDEFHGAAMYDFNNQSFDSRNPFFTGSELHSFSNQSVFANFSGPIKKQRAWWTFNYSWRMQNKTALINAQTLDSNLNVVPVNEGLSVPRLRPQIEPGIDLQITPANHLSVIYLHGSDNTTNLGAGAYSLASHAYSLQSTYNEVRTSDSAQLSPHLLTSNQFLILHEPLITKDNISAPGLIVPGAFEGGGAQMGSSEQVRTWEEINSLSSYSKGNHTVKWGAALDITSIRNTSYANFGGTYTFQGGSGPQLTSDLQPIPGTSLQLTALDVYQRTLLLQNAGVDPATIRALGGGAYQFALNSGTPTVNLNEVVLGLFAGDEWRVRSNVSLNYGLRYEQQTDIPTGGKWAPRVGVAWAPQRFGGKTVIRGGLGAFYADISSDAILDSLLYNGTTQQSYLVLNPDFFPSIPTPQELAADQSPQQLQLLNPHLERGQLWQASIGIEQELSSHLRLSAAYAEQRGIRVQLARNINAPLPGTYSGPGTGVYPFGDQNVRLSTESTGLSRIHELSVTPSILFKNFTMSGSYRLSYGKTDAEPGTLPSDPYNISLDWGPSTYADVRNNFVFFATIQLPLKMTLGGFFLMSSGSPYNITTGLDLNGDASLTDRPALLSGVTPAACSGSYLHYEPAFGCFQLNPSPTNQTTRNSARGPWQTNLSEVNLQRDWKLKHGPALQAKAKTLSVGDDDDDHTSDSDGPTIGLGIEAENPLNHTVLGTPEGDLSSPNFGQYLSSVSGRGVWGRQITLKLNVTF